MIPDDYECDGQMSIDQFIENNAIDAIRHDDSKRFEECFEKAEKRKKDGGGKGGNEQ